MRTDEAKLSERATSSAKAPAGWGGCAVLVVGGYGHESSDSHGQEDGIRYIDGVSEILSLNRPEEFLGPVSGGKDRDASRIAPQ